MPSPRPNRSRRSTQPGATSREDKKAETRRRLLDAAAVLVARHGALGTSLDQIAERAGLTKGAIYSNFESKEELLFALADRAELPVVDLREVLHDDGSVADNLEAVGRAVARELSRASERTWQLALEVMHFATRNPVARRKLATSQREDHREGGAAIERLAATRGEGLPMPGEQLDVVMSALAWGLAQKRAIDPAAVPDELFPAAFRLLAGDASGGRSQAAASGRSARR